MNEISKASSELFYDPFAEAGEENYDPMIAHAGMWERYKQREVEHDYTADEFLADTQALMMDSQFLGRFEEAQMIAARMHQLCGEDHGLNQSLQSNQSFNSFFSSFGSQSELGHDHTNGHRHNHDDGEEDDKKKKKKKRDQARQLRWL